MPGITIDFLKLKILHLSKRYFTSPFPNVATSEMTALVTGNKFGPIDVTLMLVNLKTARFVVRVVLITILKLFDPVGTDSVVSNANVSPGCVNGRTPAVIVTLTVK